MSNSDNNRRERKKILHVVEAFGGGVYTFLVALANASCQEYDVTILYGVRNQTPENIEKDFDERVHLIKTKHFTRKISPTKDLLSLFEIRKTIKKLKPEIVHLHSSKSGLLGRIGINCEKRRVFYTPHGYSFLKEDDSRVKREIYYFLERVGALANCKTIAVSKGEYDVARIISKNCTYVNNGIELPKEKLSMHPEINTENPVFVTLGRISYQKNPSLFNDIAKAFPDFKFIWIGDGDLRDELTSENIEITGWANHKDALDYLIKGDIFLLPSLWEGLPISLLEAMYLGKICIVSNIIGNKDVIKTATNGFIASNFSDYVNIINDIIKGNYKITDITKNAYNDILSKYNTDVMTSKYLDIYRY